MKLEALFEILREQVRGARAKCGNRRVVIEAEVVMTQGVVTSARVKPPWIEAGEVGK